MMAGKTGKRRPAHEQDTMIIEALRGMGQPASAYELIEQLHNKATLAPQTVYRSLDRLIAEGQAHRLESLNAFVACRHPSHRGAVVFAICDDCRSVTEFNEADAVNSLAAWAKKAKFDVRQMTMELRGRCKTCARSSARAQAS
jgi:Fur family zinc uptake transcriptional regulator